MPLALLCDEHIPYPVIEGLRRRGVDVTTVQQLGLLDQQGYIPRLTKPAYLIANQVFTRFVE